MMDRSGNEGPRHFVRVEVTLQVKFACLEDMESMIKASTIDVSRGGMFINSVSRRKSGQKVMVELPGPDGHGIPVQGVIRHIRYMDGEPIGFGIEFENISADAAAVIEQLLPKTATIDSIEN